jgi:hypothetical protein
VQIDANLTVVDNEERTPLIKAILSRNQHPQLNYQICMVVRANDNRIATTKNLAITNIRLTMEK